MMMEEDRAGALVEYSPTSKLFTNPKDKRTEDYIPPVDLDKSSRRKRMKRGQHFIRK